VDLLCEGDAGKGIRTWIQEITVISVDRHFSRAPSKEESQEVSTVTVSVTPEEGRLLASAVREGRIHWFLRNPDEPSKARATFLSKTKREEEKIEIWKAGVQEPRTPFPSGESG
jgi:Flp pilus assembly protein CpaB